MLNIWYMGKSPTTESFLWAWFEWKDSNSLWGMPSSLFLKQKNKQAPFGKLLYLFPLWAKGICIRGPNVMKLIPDLLFWKLEFRIGIKPWDAASIASHCLCWNISFNIWNHVINIMVPLVFLISCSISTLPSSLLAETPLFFCGNLFFEAAK